MKSLQIIADENIPGVKKLFEPLGNVVLVNGRRLDSSQLQGADILLVRSVTNVDKALLAGTTIRFVATATIGIDHLDIDYLKANNIGWANAPGSNANSVVDYVISTFCRLEGVLECLLAGGVVGIIGMGNVGSRLYRRLSVLGIKCIGYDPLIEQSRYPVLTDLDSVLKADVICCHAPLTKDGNFPSYQLLDRDRLAKLPPETVLINAGRGEVVDSNALLEILEDRHDLCIVFDVWEHEPRINIDLLKRIDIGSPHIAGYSLDGKLAGASMIYQACYEFLGIEKPLQTQSEKNQLTLRITEQRNAIAAMKEAVLACYDVAKDDQNLRGALLHSNGDDLGVLFDQLRKNYPVRREFSRYQIINADELGANVVNGLQALGFCC